MNLLAEETVKKAGFFDYLRKSSLLDCTIKNTYHIFRETLPENLYIFLVLERECDL